MQIHKRFTAEQVKVLWKQIGGRWIEFEGGTIGNDRFFQSLILGRQA